MTAYNESTGPRAIWRLLFAFVFLKYLISIFVLYFLLIFLLVNYCFSLSLRYHYIYMSSWGFFHILMPVSVQQWRVEIGTCSCRYILRYPQSCNFFMKDKSVVIWFAFAFLLNFFVILYFCYILLSHGDA